MALVAGAGRRCTYTVCTDESSHLHTLTNRRNLSCELKLLAACKSLVARRALSFLLALRAWAELRATWWRAARRASRWSTPRTRRRRS